MKRKSISHVSIVVQPTKKNLLRRRELLLIFCLYKHTVDIYIYIYSRFWQTIKWESNLYGLVEYAIAVDHTESKTTSTNIRLMALWLMMVTTISCRCGAVSWTRSPHSYSSSTNQIQTIRKDYIICNSHILRGKSEYCPLWLRIRFGIAYMLARAHIFVNSYKRVYTQNAICFLPNARAA